MRDALRIVQVTTLAQSYAFNGQYRNDPQIFLQRRYGQAIKAIHKILPNESRWLATSVLKVPVRYVFFKQVI